MLIEENESSQVNTILILRASVSFPQRVGLQSTKAPGPRQGQRSPRGCSVEDNDAGNQSVERLMLEVILLTVTHLKETKNTVSEIVMLTSKKKRLTKHQYITVVAQSPVRKSREHQQQIIEQETYLASTS